MNEPLQRIAALLPQLSHAELRVLIVLTATARRSTRDIAAAAGLARSNTKISRPHAHRTRPYRLRRRHRHPSRPLRAAIPLGGNVTDSTPSPDFSPAV